MNWQPVHKPFYLPPISFLASDGVSYSVYSGLAACKVIKTFHRRASSVQCSRCLSSPPVLSNKASGQGKQRACGSTGQPRLCMRAGCKTETRLTIHQDWSH